MKPTQPVSSHLANYYLILHSEKNGGAVRIFQTKQNSRSQQKSFMTMFVWTEQGGWKRKSTAADFIYFWTSPFGTRTCLTNLWALLVVIGDSFTHLHYFCSVCDSLYVTVLLCNINHDICYLQILCSIWLLIFVIVTAFLWHLFSVEIY